MGSSPVNPLSVLWGARDLVSDSGGAHTSNECEAVCRRLHIQHEPIESTKGESYQNLVETHFNIQRRLYDYQFSLAQTRLQLEQRHQALIQTYNTTAHQGLLNDQRLPPIPLEVLGDAKGRTYPQEELARRFSHALFPRVTNRLAVSICTATISMWRRVYPTHRCCCGWPASSCGPSLRTSCSRSIAAATIGRTARSKTSARRCSTTDALPRGRVP